MKVVDAQSPAQADTAAGTEVREERQAAAPQGRGPDWRDPVEADAGEALRQGRGVIDAADRSKPAAVAAEEGVGRWLDFTTYWSRWVTARNLAAERRRDSARMEWMERMAAHAGFNLQLDEVA